MYKKVNNAVGFSIYFNDEEVFRLMRPELKIEELQRSFDFVPWDSYFNNTTRYRTTSRIQVREGGYHLLPIKPLYQPSYVNPLNNYGAIDRNYADVPASLLRTTAFDVMMRHWAGVIPFDFDTFSIHQIRTTDNGNPTPEGRHFDGTDWTGVYIARRYNLTQTAGNTLFWTNTGEVIVDEVLPEGSLIAFCDRYFTHLASSLERLEEREPCFRDVFVITFPEHGTNRARAHGRIEPGETIQA